jgi:hypothetical protein
MSDVSMPGIYLLGKVFEADKIDLAQQLGKSDLRLTYHHLGSIQLGRR